ncbi:MAG: hypothetical protein ABI536_05400 [Gallionella sp.]
MRPNMGVDPWGLDPSLAPEELSQASAVSWGAIIAGAAATAILSLILLILGTGLGLSSVSPWANNGIAAKTFGISAIIWITLTQIIASGMGGYLAGRLRSRWVATHTDEIYFRDTAHGFLAWTVAALTTAVVMTSVVGSIVSGGVQAGASVAGGAANTALAATAGGIAANGSAMNKSGNDSAGPLGYFIDSLFRKGPNAGGSNTGGNAFSRNGNASVSGGGSMANSGADQPGSAASMAEVTRIYTNSLQAGSMSQEDVQYAGQVIAQRTGLTQQEAEKRVTDTFATMQTKLRDAENTAKDVADKARKTSAYMALWLFISLLFGAFTASLAAVYGGRRRDL